VRRATSHATRDETTNATNRATSTHRDHHHDRRPRRGRRDSARSVELGAALDHDQDHDQDDGGGTVSARVGVAAGLTVAGGAGVWTLAGVLADGLPTLMRVVAAVCLIGTAGCLAMFGAGMWQAYGPAPSSTGRRVGASAVAGLVPPPAGFDDGMGGVGGWRPSSATPAAGPIVVSVSVSDLPRQGTGTSSTTGGPRAIGAGR
jgi:hypothetical protein